MQLAPLCQYTRRAKACAIIAIVSVRAVMLCLLIMACLLNPAAGRAAPPNPKPPAASVQTQSVRLPARTPRLARYAETRYALYFGGTAYALLLLWGVLQSGLAARLRDWAERRARRPWAQTALYYAALSLLLALWQAPLTWFGGYALEHRYGLSHQAFTGWLADEAKAWGVDMVVGALLVALLLGLVHRSPRRWALWLWAALVPLIAFGIFLAPLVIDPLFNRFTPLPPGPLRTQIAQLAARAGIPNAPIYVADKSKQTDTANAYVTGLGGSARIVIWDTTLRELPDDEVVGIVGHEMGHYVLKHIYWGFLESILGLLVGLPLLQGLASRLVSRFGARWQVRGLTDRASVPVFLLAWTLLAFLADPLTNGLSRRIEHQADAYGLQVTHNGPAMARAFVFFAEHDLSDPDPPPFVKFWLFSHPPLGERIHFVLGRNSAPGV